MHEHAQLPLVGWCPSSRRPYRYQSIAQNDLDFLLTYTTESHLIPCTHMFLPLITSSIGSHHTVLPNSTSHFDFFPPMKSSDAALLWLTVFFIPLSATTHLGSPASLSFATTSKFQKRTACQLQKLYYLCSSPIARPAQLVRVQ